MIPVRTKTSDIRLAVLNKLGAIAKKRENLMNNDDFYALTCKTDEKQMGILMQVISNRFVSKPCAIPNTLH